MALAVALWAIGFGIMFRGWAFGGFDGIFGDEGDARILIAVLEHWHRVFTGVAISWRNPTYFYPEPGALGFTDAYFLYGVVYSAFRALGSDAFTAFMGLMALLSALGFAGFLHLAVRRFGASVPAAAVGAYLFAFANMIAVKLGHAQSYCAMLLPLVIDLLAAAVLTCSRWRALGLAGGAGLLHALIFFTAFLTGWFSFLAAGLTALVFALLSGPARALALLRQTVSQKALVPLGYLAGFAAGITPFLIIYLPVFLHGASYDFSMVATSSPLPTDIINVGAGNLVWGTALANSGIAGLPDRPLVETELGYSPLVFLLWAGATAALLVRWLRGPARMSEHDRVVLAMGIALFVGWLLQLDYLGFRPWKLLWELVPGGMSVRTTFRLQIVANLAACLILVDALDRIAGIAARPRVARGAAAVLALVVMVEQLNQAPLTFSRAEELAWLGRISAPPPTCHAFFVVPRPSNAFAPWYVHQSDAMLVSQLVGLPTLNGNASVFPGGWQMFDPAGAEYIEALRDWVSVNRMVPNGLCALDTRAARWSVPRG